MHTNVSVYVVRRDLVQTALRCPNTREHGTCHEWRFIGAYIDCKNMQDILTNLLTYSMEQSSSWEANRISASQGIPRILWNPKVHYRMQSAHQLSLSWASSIQSILPHPSSWRSILILSSHLRLGLPSGLFPSGFPTKIMYTPFSPPYVLNSPPISFLIRKVKVIKRGLYCWGNLINVYRQKLLQISRHTEPR